MSAISVIVPVYNVEKYLNKCVKSVLAQSYPDFELILVDDGSADNCPAMCDEFAEEDSRVRVIHKENGGLSSARNAGVEQAGGDFVFYLDSDDYIEETALEELLFAQKETGADIVVGNYYYTYDDHESLAEVFEKPVRQFSNQDAMLQLVTGKIQTFAWGKLIRKKAAKKYRFPEGKLFEDHFWTHRIFADAESVTVIEKPIVHYLQRNESISYSVTLKRLDVLDGWAVRKEFLQKNYPSFIKSYMVHITGQFLNLAWLCLVKMKKDKKEAFGVLRNFSFECDLMQYAENGNKALIKAINRGLLPYALCAVRKRIMLLLKRNQ